MKLLPLFFLFLFSIHRLNAQAQDQWAGDFKSPPSKFKTMPFWHLNGKLDSAEIDRQMSDARNSSGFGGITILPVTAQYSFDRKNVYPGMTPDYNTKEYFAYYGHILRKAKELGLEIIWYDDVDFPSGTAGGELLQKFPADTRKILNRQDTTLSGGINLSLPLPEGKLLSALAVQKKSGEQKDLRLFIQQKTLKWKVPSGEWNIQLFTVTNAPNTGINDRAVDYLDPVAIQHYFSINHDVFAKQFSKYFGNTIKQTFFDDVGFYTGAKHGERTWTNRFNEKFMQLYGRDPAIYYPALWDDIGVNTQAARVAFFNTRAELLAEGYPKMASLWDEKHGLVASGHPPGNYEIQPVDMNADIIKYYRHEQIPTMDLIFYHEHGREGFKLVSSAGILYDRPLVGAEIYGAINFFRKNEMDKNLLYQAAMEVFARGINFLIPHGMWYTPDSMRIPPLISAYNPLLADELPKYNEWAGRCMELLRGGQTISDIGVIYPITSLQGWFHFQAKDNKDWGKYAPPGTDYLKLSDLLTNEVHRDFTFLHPETVGSAKTTVGMHSLTLNNQVNTQKYSVIILPAGKVISVKALEKIKNFFNAGGKVIATNELPAKSAEFGQDEKVIRLSHEIFGESAYANMQPPAGTFNSNPRGGEAAFLVSPDASLLKETLEKMGAQPDVSFSGNPSPNSHKGTFSYIHKRKEGREIYFFANSTDDEINTVVQVRGKITPWQWNPHNGEIEKVTGSEQVRINGGDYTKFPLHLNGIQSLFILSEPGIQTAGAHKKIKPSGKKH